MVTSTSNCNALVGNTLDAETLVAGSIALIHVDINVTNDLGNPIDCAIDVMMKVIE